MLEIAQIAQMTAGYSEKQLQAIAHGFCPNCFEQGTRYRILQTYYSEAHQKNVHRVKCADVVRCEWDEELPTYRADNGLEGFFES